MLKSFFSVVVTVVGSFLFMGALLVLFTLLNSVNFKYPEPANFQGYGFYSGTTYVRTSNRNPFTSPNHSNKDTLVLVTKDGRWLKFNNGETLELHSDSLNLYQWEKL